MIMRSLFRCFAQCHAVSFRLSSIVVFAILFVSCTNTQQQFDATGTFEADEVIVSSEATGRITMLNIEEGKTIVAGAVVGAIDSVQTVLRKLQLQAQIRAILAKKPDISLQLASLQEQIASAEREKTRFEKLLFDRAVTQKQYDDIKSQVDVLNKQLIAQRSSLATTVQGLDAEIQPLTAQIAQTDDQLRKCSLVNPISGTVLTKYVQAQEFATAGKALYKIADMSMLTLRVYIAGTQIGQFKIGQTVKVYVDDGVKNYKEYSGEVAWIAEKAEFTPKTIQTKDERANLVYPIKIHVKNDGFLKIGMYGEVKL